MPPSGGFEALRYKRNLPFRGPSGVMMLLGVTAVSAFGFWRLGKGNLERRCVLSLFSICFYSTRVSSVRGRREKGIGWIGLERVEPELTVCKVVTLHARMHESTKEWM